MDSLHKSVGGQTRRFRLTGNRQLHMYTHGGQSEVGVVDTLEDKYV